MLDRMGGSNAEAGRERALQDAAVCLTLAKNCGQNERKADNSHAWAVAKLRWLFAVRMRAAARSTSNKKTGPNSNARGRTSISTRRKQMEIYQTQPARSVGDQSRINTSKGKWIRFPRWGLNHMVPETPVVRFHQENN